MESFMQMEITVIFQFCNINNCLHCRYRYKNDRLTLMQVFSSKYIKVPWFNLKIG